MPDKDSLMNGAPLSIPIVWQYGMELPPGFVALALTKGCAYVAPERRNGKMRLGEMRALGGL